MPATLEAAPVPALVERLPELRRLRGVRAQLQAGVQYLAAAADARFDVLPRKHRSAGADTNSKQQGSQFLVHPLLLVEVDALMGYCCKMARRRSRPSRHNDSAVSWTLAGIRVAGLGKSDMRCFLLEPMSASSFR